jgi:hypothetical protein
VRARAHPDGHRAIAVDKAGDENARPEASSAGDSGADGLDELELVAYVAHGGDSRSQVGGPPIHLRVVSVHIPETGHEVLPRYLDPGRVPRDRHLRARPDSHDAVPAK